MNSQSPSPLPLWAAEIALLYEAHATSQFLLYGNVDDDFPGQSCGQPDSLQAFLLNSLLASFEVVLAYDLGNGVRVLKGGKIFSEWKGAAVSVEGQKSPRAAIEGITQYLRYVANLATLGQKSPQVAVIVNAANLVAPALPHALSYDLNAVALLMREWSHDKSVAQQRVATFLVAENLSELHLLLSTNPAAVAIQIPLPDSRAIAEVLRQDTVQSILGEFGGREAELGSQLTGVTLKSIRRLLRRRVREKQSLSSGDVAAIKKALVENEAAIEFIEPSRTLDDFHGQEALKTWLRQDLALWKRGDLRAMPMGYLLCGPVGTGKTYAVECLAGEAGVPVVKLGNFRDRWVGSTEGNLEKIFRMLRALGRCIVFIDEADQSLGRRDAGTSDSGLSGRIYAMFAAEMSDRRNRGRIVWVLASSRPDLIEVDLKRPGRVDVKIPLLPTASTGESFRLLQALARRVELDIEDQWESELEPIMPRLLTPGAAEALALKLYRQVHAANLPLQAALVSALQNYQPPVAPEILAFQTRLAIAESTDTSFVPSFFLESKDNVAPVPPPEIARYSRSEEYDQRPMASGSALDLR